MQGDRTMGIHHLPSAEFLDRLGARFNFEPPRQHGMDTVAAISAMYEGRVKVFISMGGNFYSATPDTEAVAVGLGRCRLTVHVSTKLNRAHLYPGQCSLILPCLGRTERDVQAGGEQFVTVEDSMSMVHRSQGALPGASEQLRSEPAIVAGMAAAALGEDWSELAGDYDRVRDAIAEVVPGFEQFNERVRSAAGFQLPNPARELDFTAVGGRARFTVHAIPNLTLPADRYRLMTLRSHDQYNTTIYGLDDRYRGVFGGRRVIFLNPDDLEAAGLTARQRVDIISEYHGQERRVQGFAVVPYDLPRGCAGAYFPEANPLVPLESVADKSGTPTSKSIIVRLQPS